MIESGPNWTLHLGDCIEGMRALHDQQVDVTISDPPYEGEVHSEGRRVRDPGGAKGAAKYRKMVEAPLPFAAISEGQRTEVAWHIARATRRWILIFCQVEAAHKWAAALTCAPFGIEYVRTMVWVKPDGQPQFTGDRPGMGYESIARDASVGTAAADSAFSSSTRTAARPTRIRPRTRQRSRCRSCASSSRYSATQTS
jgi:hypothetical protein